MWLRRGSWVLAAASVLLGAAAVVVLVVWLAARPPIFPAVLPLLALSFVCAVWARRLDRRFAAARGEVPPGWDGVDLDVQTTRLRTLAARATAFAGVWAVVTLAAAAGAIALLAPDPDDPTAEANAFAVLIVAVLALVGAVFSLVAAAGWRRRYRAVAETGWRPGKATVRAGGQGLPRVTVTPEEGADLPLQASTSVRGAAHFADFPGTEVRVAGCDRWMVVLFPRGLFRGGPYAVPVRSLERRPGARPTLRSASQG
jgi:hypothetical protein